MRKQHRLILTLLVITLCVGGIFFLIQPQTAQAPQGKPLPSHALTPEQASLIALSDFPQGQAEWITLEQDHLRYIYVVQIKDNGARYRVKVALDDGTVQAITTLDHAAQPFLSLNGLLTLAQNRYPAAVFTGITLTRQKGVTVYQLTGRQDQNQLTLTMDPVGGTVLAQTQTFAAADTAGKISLMSALGQITAHYPDWLPIALNYDAEQKQYRGILLNSQYRCEVLSDNDTIFSETLTPLAANDPARNFLRHTFITPPPPDLPPE